LTQDPYLSAILLLFFVFDYFLVSNVRMQLKVVEKSERV